MKRSLLLLFSDVVLTGLALSYADRAGVLVLPGTQPEVVITDLLGQTVAVPARGVFEPGTHTVAFHGDHLPSGIYYDSLHAGGRRIETRKFILLK